jgi:hypothetical protein
MERLKEELDKLKEELTQAQVRNLLAFLVQQNK